MALALERLIPAYAAASPGIDKTPSAGNPNPINLNIASTPVQISGRTAQATTVNGSLPGPLVRLREGQDALLRVTNNLSKDSSIHWHGLILPYTMDGVPGLSYDGIGPGETFEYRFPVSQSGTYWYHSHSDLQEQTGVYGPLVIDAAKPEPWSYDKEFVVVLSDWTFENPHRVMAKLKKQADYFNFQQKTVLDFIRDARKNGLGSTVMDQMMWSRMRMMPSDIADVTGYTYTYLLNGKTAEVPWAGLFRPGERIRMRFINASAMSYFDVRIPGLKLRVVQADGQNIQPVDVDEFRISVAETYDVLVTPDEEKAYPVFAEAMDRSGFALGALSPGKGLLPKVPPRRKRPLLTMKDMGMPMMGHDMGGMDHHGMHMKKPADDSLARVHGPDHHGPGNAAVAMLSESRLGDPGIGLEDANGRVLVYTDLRSDKKFPDHRPHSREIELHLTGNMERYMWSFDGEQFSKRTEPIRLEHGERVRLTFVNDTMMNHPIHLHGMWMVLDNGNGEYNPRKHTINVKPAEHLSADVSADATGNWAFHCHLLFHMHMGMFRVVSISKPLEKGKKS